MSAKIIVVITSDGIESVSVASRDTIERAIFYQLCTCIEPELSQLNSAVKRLYEEESVLNEN